MSEIDILKKRIIDSGYDGVETSQIRDDYSPVGQKIINQLCDSGDFWQQRSPSGLGLHTGPWKIWGIRFRPK